jgi:hypothetical protein
VEEAAAAVGALHEQADQLARAVGVFRLAADVQPAQRPALLRERGGPALRLVA